MGVRDIYIFTVTIYIKYWFQTASSIYSHRNDLQLLKSLKKYIKVNETLPKNVMTKFLGSLLEELVELNFLMITFLLLPKENCIKKIKEWSLY